MEIALISLAVVCSVSIGLNVFLFFKIRKPKLDLSAQDLLHDLTGRRQAILSVEVINPDGLLHWRGRH